MTNNELKRAYEKLLKDVETNEFYETDLTNRVNCYRCPACHHITKTKDVDAGVTPFMHNCEKCGAMAQSTMYRDIAPRQEPTQEWYRPTLEQVQKMHRRGKHHLVSHILQGGLDVRSIEVKLPLATNAG